MCLIRNKNCFTPIFGGPCCSSPSFSVLCFCFACLCFVPYVQCCFVSWIRYRLLEVDPCCSLCPVLISVLWCPWRCPIKYEVRFAFIFSCLSCLIYEESEDTNGVIRKRLSKKNRHNNGQKYKRTNNDLQHTHRTCCLLCRIVVSKLLSLRSQLCIVGQSWLWWYGSWIYNYLCNQCLSTLKLRVRTSFIRYNIMW